MKQRVMLTVLPAVLLQASASFGMPPISVRFPSLDAAAERVATGLDGYLLRPEGTGRHPALVFLHGCLGLMHLGKISSRESDWAVRLTRLGYVVLMLDSLSPRGSGEMWSQRGFNRKI